MESNIYLLQVGDFFKIGYTKNSVEKRVKQLQTGTPDIIYIKNVFRTKHGMTIERTLHRLLSTKRISGEYFDLDYTDVTNFISLCEKYELALDCVNKNNKYE